MYSVVYYYYYYYYYYYVLCSVLFSIICLCTSSSVWSCPYLSAHTSYSSITDTK